MKNAGDDRLVRATEQLLDGVRDLVRQCQRELLEEPDPESPWWFLVDPSSLS